ncbi:unnamed protein product [Zymoseptoria tritici ST99CH_1E4]|uniref:Extragenic suppressor of kinetochore protein 1 n=1 Tax=Zymoseptoria tritici ST99CH_1E4 TaxID=1276532 RepID=A0A2H1G6B8_ZYMTR|nr:unnamed protein product [Zymoseptoria tritici ST99CH_1E4]
MFWRFGGYANISTLDTILDKQDVTVEELLDESDLIQELKQQNSKLIEFLRDDAVLKKLLTYVTADKTDEEPEEKGKEAEKEKSAEDDEKTTTGLSFFGKGKGRARSKSSSKKDGDGETEQEKRETQRKKYALVSCEVLSSEVWSLTEAVLEQQDALREFWQYIRRPAPLDPLQAGYFTKVNETLLDKKTEDMLAFFKGLDGIVPAMLQHVDCPMVMDLLLKIISLEKHEGGQGIVDWLQGQDLIPLLLSYLSPEQSSATQTSAGDFLKAIITISANATTQDQSVIGPNELTRQLVSEECINTLIQDMLLGGNPLTVGVGIIIEVIRKNNSDYDLDNQIGPEPKTSDPIYLGTLLRQFATHVPDFMRLIRAPSAKKPDLKAAFGRKIEPLGFDRFKTCELMAELLHCSNMGLLNERGTDEEVRKRDAERERLKAQGKLTTPRLPDAHDNSFDEFGSSVDSHGFHHAERPSQEEMNEREEDRRLEVQNASDEDGFEQVNAPSEDQTEDEPAFDDLNDTIDRTTHGGLPLLEKVEKRTPSDIQVNSPTDIASIPAPLSPKKQTSPTKLMHFDPPPTHAADSPTTAGVTDQIKSLDVDEDTVMSEFGQAPAEEDEDGPSELERALARPEDKPAPLFVRKDSPTKEEVDADSSQDIDQSVATLHGHEPAPTNGDRAPYDTELDGSPVVGDLLKIQFVEHQVVPTILDFFFRFPWNNFLHNVVYDVVQQVFNGTLDRGYNRSLAFDLFTPTPLKDGETIETIGLASGHDITDRILDGQKASDVSQKERNMRLGYMGHLTLIAEEVCKFGNKHPPEALDEAITERVTRAEWVTYVEGVLADTRDKDNAVLGGVRPETAIGIRSMGSGGGVSAGFSNNTANTLANAGLGGNGGGMTPQDTLAMSEGTVGQSFEINAGTMLSGFGDDDDDEMEDEAITRERDRRAAFEDDEQNSLNLSPEAHTSSAPAPLNIPPSRARRTLAARLAQKSNQNASGNPDEVEDELALDPDAADAAALEAAKEMPDSPPSIDLDAASTAVAGSGAAAAAAGDASGVGAGQQLRASRFSGLFSSSDSDDSSGDSSSSPPAAGSRRSGVPDDEDAAGRDVTLEREGGDYEDDEEEGEWSDTGFGTSSGEPVAKRMGGKARRPSTTEAKVRVPLDDGDDDEEEGLGMGRRLTLGDRQRSGVEGGGREWAARGGMRGELEEEEDEDSSSGDEGAVTIKTRRTS